MGIKDWFKRKEPVASSYYVILDHEQPLPKHQFDETMKSFSHQYRKYPYVVNSFEDELIEHGVYLFDEYKTKDEAQGMYEQLMAAKISCEILTDYEYESLMHDEFQVDDVSFNGKKYALIDVVEEQNLLDEEFIARTTNKLIWDEEQPINGWTNSLGDMFSEDMEAFEDDDVDNYDDDYDFD